MTTPDSHAATPRGGAGQNQGAAMKKGWETRSLGELCRIRTGKKDVNEGNPEGKYPFFTCAAQHTFSDNYSFDAEALLIAGNGDVGKVSYYKGKFEAYQRTYVLSDFTDVSPRFLYLILDGKLKDTVSKQKLGNTMPYIKVGMLTDFQLPVPPLVEQQRIVGLLDEAFAGLATAKANAEKNLQNARALFESHLQAVFTHRGKGWVEKKLDDVTDLITCGVAKRPEYVPEGIPFLSAKNVKSGQVIWSGHQYVSEETHRALTKNNKPQIGDILYTRVGSYGEAAIIDRDVEFSIFVSLTLIKPKPAVLNSFLKHYLNSSAVKELAAASITGSGVGNLNVGAVREFPIHLPPLPEQRSIVSQLDDMREETQRLASFYERKLAALEALKKSLLHQAFTGELRAGTFHGRDLHAWT